MKIFKGILSLSLLLLFQVSAKSYFWTESFQVCYHDSNCPYNYFEYDITHVFQQGDFGISVLTDIWISDPVYCCPWGLVFDCYTESCNYRERSCNCIITCSHFAEK